MTTIKVRREDLNRVKQITKSIGGYISGRANDQYNIGNVFWNTLVAYLFQKIYEAYVVKSYGGTDELGNSWPPLAESTVSLKKRQTGALRSARTRERKLRGLSSPKDARRLIMRETDKLITSLKPSIIRNSSFYAPRNNQLVYRTQKSITVGTEVEYAKYHDNTRPVIPPNASIWVVQGINAATNAAINRMVEVLR